MRKLNRRKVKVNAGGEHRGTPKSVNSPTMIDLVIADAHTDLLLELAHREHLLGETDVFAQTWLPLLAAGGVGLQVCPIFVRLDRQPEGTLREALGQATSFLRAARENRDRVVTLRSASDFDSVERGEKIGLVLSLEGVEQFGYEVWPADVFWELGVRMASLTWNRRNPYADGAAESGGLSQLGARLVDRLVELGVILDLAHASPATFADVLRRSGDAPVLVSHAACRAVNDHPRNVSDEQLRALAERGGLLGLMLHPLAIDHERRTIARVVDHLDHAASVMGVEHVCLGGDFVQRLSRVLPPSAPLPDGLMPAGLEEGSAIEGLAGPEDYPALSEALATHGWSAADIDAVTGVNLLGFLRRALPPG
jgi:membrane dipeptidase